jgi:diaminopimelate epimerase
MQFTKLQGAGNDFVLVEADSDQYNWPSQAQIMCQRHFGVGADGLLVLLPSEAADFGLQVFNADGSEAEACGNGLRCSVKYAASRGLISPGCKEVTVETLAGIRKASLLWKADGATRIQVAMGPPEFDAVKIPVKVEPGRGKLVDIKLLTDYPVSIEGWGMLLSFLSIGNPHAIYFQEQPPVEFPLSRLGPLVEHHELFPNLVNFEVARVISRQQVEVRVWERGVGETLACGSGACAVAVAAQLLGFVDRRVTIDLPGGTLEVEWNGAGEVLLSGPAEIVFTGQWPD